MPPAVSPRGDPVPREYASTVWSCVQIAPCSALAIGDISLKDPATNPFVSTANDFGDVTTHSQLKSPSSQTEYTLFSDTNGPKTIKTIVGSGSDWFGGSTSSDGVWKIPDYDGNNVGDYPIGFGNFSASTSDGASMKTNVLTGIHYRDSFKIKWTHKGNGLQVSQIALVLGTGPLDAAIVSDGENPYSFHENVSQEDVDALAAPSGYTIVTGFEVADDVSDVWSSVWNEQQQTFVQP